MRYPRPVGRGIYRNTEGSPSGRRFEHGRIRRVHCLWAGPLYLCWVVR